MQRLNFRSRQRFPNLVDVLRERLIYVPGALIMLYGLWLALTA